MPHDTARPFRLEWLSGALVLALILMMTLIGSKTRRSCDHANKRHIVPKAFGCPKHALRLCSSVLEIALPSPMWTPGRGNGSPPCQMATGRGLWTEQFSMGESSPPLTAQESSNQRASFWCKRRLGHLGGRDRLIERHVGAIRPFYTSPRLGSFRCRLMVTLRESVPRNVDTDRAEHFPAFDSLLSALSAA